MKSILVALLLLVAGLVALAAPAQAQTGTTIVKVEFKSAQDDNGRVMPEVELVEIPFYVTLQFPALPGVCLSSYNIHLEIVEKPHYASMVLSPRSFSGTVGATVAPVYTGQAQEYARTFVGKMYVSVTRDAPAFKDDVYKVKATAVFPPNVNGCTISGSSGTGAAIMKNDFVPGLVVSQPGDHLSGQRGVLPIGVTNIGNGPTRVDFTFRPEHASVFSLLEAPPTHLESRAYKGSSAIYKATIPMQYALDEPGRHMVEVAIRAVYDGAAADTLSDEQTIAFVAEWDEEESPREPGPAESTDDLPALPGFAHLAVLVSLLGAALVLRRRNR